MEEKEKTKYKGKKGELKKARQQVVTRPSVILV